MGSGHLEGDRGQTAEDIRRQGSPAKPSPPCHPPQTSIAERLKEEAFFARQGRYSSQRCPQHKLRPHRRDTAQCLPIILTLPLACLIVLSLPKDQARATLKRESSQITLQTPHLIRRYGKQKPLAKRSQPFPLWF